MYRLYLKLDNVPVLCQDMVNFLVIRSKKRLFSSIYFIPYSVFRQVHSALPNRVLHRMRPGISAFNFQYLVCFLNVIQKLLGLLPRINVTSVPPPLLVLKCNCTNVVKID